MTVGTNMIRIPARVIQLPKAMYSDSTNQLVPHPIDRNWYLGGKGGKKHFLGDMTESTRRQPGDLHGNILVLTMRYARTAEDVATGLIKQLARYDVSICEDDGSKVNDLKLWCKNYIKVVTIKGDKIHTFGDEVR
jgi:hypothetical protein